MNKKSIKLWLEVIYYGIKSLAKFLPVAAPVQFVLKIIALIKFYKSK